jgi:spore photoproduct lyase
MKRHHPEQSVNIATNHKIILYEIDKHLLSLPEKKPNQCDAKYWTYDISCNEDFALHAKFHKWRNIFDYFVDANCKGSFATKYVNKNLLEYNPQKKVRIRFSLMPEDIRQIVEPNTSTTEERINAINLFVEAGYEVHINFSPVIVYTGWLRKYIDLFYQIRNTVNPDYWNEVLCEVIFLTHNKKKHIYNLKNKIPGEDLLWTPQWQENKVSEFGGKNLRYDRDVKAASIKQWTNVHNDILPWNTIRYIF